MVVLVIYFNVSVYSVFRNRQYLNKVTQIKGRGRKEGKKEREEGENREKKRGKREKRGKKRERRGSKTINRSSSSYT